jgi:hypothetical protein
MDFIIQPGVATTTCRAEIRCRRAEWLRRVSEYKLNQPQRGLNPGARNGDATRVGVDDF